MDDPNRARLIDGVVVPGAWVVPGVGSSRFKSKREAEKCAERVAYGGCFETKIVRERSRTRPGRWAFQVYIRSLGAIEGLIDLDSSPG